MSAMQNNGLDAAMNRLLRNLRQFMRAYPKTMGAPMPDHEMVWVEVPGNGPAKVILDAIKANPAMWREALPPEVCIVPRKQICEATGLSGYMLDYFASHGENMVFSYAARTPAKPD
jgi:hypothetical protein